MAVKSFVFRENWVGSKVAGMKITFFAIFDPTWSEILENKYFFAIFAPHWAKIWP